MQALENVKYILVVGIQAVYENQVVGLASLGPMSDFLALQVPVLLRDLGVITAHIRHRMAVQGIVQDWPTSPGQDKGVLGLGVCKAGMGGTSAHHRSTSSQRRLYRRSLYISYQGE